MYSDEKKYINIMLSRQFDFLSQCLYYLTGKGYTHASIGLEEDSETFYSFNTLGFRIEKPNRWKQKDSRIQTKVFQIAVEKEKYEKVKAYIEYVKKNQEKYKYSFLGLWMAILRIPYHAKYKYFCSQFVAEALNQAKILSSSTPNCLILPNTFRDFFRKGVLEYCRNDGFFMQKKFYKRFY